jgi:hypothetical protein
MHEEDILNITRRKAASKVAGSDFSNRRRTNIPCSAYTLGRFSAKEQKILKSKSCYKFIIKRV